LTYEQDADYEDIELLDDEDAEGNGGDDEGARTLH
jgi:hypothetical protein